MSISNEHGRIQAARNKIRNKLVSLELAEGTENITQLADIIDSIIFDSGSGKKIFRRGRMQPI